MKNIKSLIAIIAVLITLPGCTQNTPVEPKAKPVNPALPPALEVSTSPQCMHDQRCPVNCTPPTGFFPALLSFLGIQTGDPSLIQTNRFNPAYFQWSGKYFPLFGPDMVIDYGEIAPPNWHERDSIERYNPRDLAKYDIPSTSPILKEPDSWWVNATNAVFELEAPGIPKGPWINPKVGPGPYSNFTNHFLGSSSNLALNINSGYKWTRPIDVGNPPFGTLPYRTYAAAHSALGVLLRGVTFMDHQQMAGSLSYATTGFHNGLTYDETGSCDDTNDMCRQIYSTALTGIEAGSYLGRQFTSEDPTTGGINGPVDVWDQAYKEHDAWDIVPADLSLLEGGRFVAVLDNKKTDVQSARAINGAPYEQGYLNQVTGAHAIVTSFNRLTWMNVGQAAGFRAILDLGSQDEETEPFTPTPGWFGPDELGERCGSRIREWYGILVDLPNGGGLQSADCYGPGGLITSSVGALFNDQSTTCTTVAAGNARALNPGGMVRGVSIPHVAGLVDDEFLGTSHVPEQGAALVTKGSVVLGDGASTTGYSADVVHVRDVLHLAPRAEPPLIDASVPPANRVGLMYFDAAHNTLRVSVAVDSGASRTEAEWSASEIAWVNLSLDTGTVSAKDVVAPGAEGQKSRSLRSAESIQAGIKRAASTEAAAEVLPASLKLLLSGEPRPGGMACTLLCSGFGNSTPRLYWRRLGMGREKTGATAWEEIEGNDLIETQLPYADDALKQNAHERAFSTMQSFGGEPGQVVELMAIDPETGQCSGASFVMGG